LKKGAYYIQNPKILIAFFTFFLCNSDCFYCQSIWDDARIGWVVVICDWLLQVAVSGQKWQSPLEQQLACLLHMNVTVQACGQQEGAARDSCKRKLQAGAVSERCKMGRRTAEGGKRAATLWLLAEMARGKLCREQQFLWGVLHQRVPAHA
jgi:hypothetical protein